MDGRCFFSSHYGWATVVCQAALLIILVYFLLVEGLSKLVMAVAEWVVRALNVR